MRAQATITDKNNFLCILFNLPLTSFLFSVLLILTSQKVEFSTVGNQYSIEDELRGSPPSELEWLIVCYVAG